MPEVKLEVKQEENFKEEWQTQKKWKLRKYYLWVCFNQTEWIIKKYYKRWDVTGFQQLSY